jgi:hypothetical protein
MVTPPPLFSSSQAIVQLDFEKDTLNAPPSNLEPRSKDHWAVVDSPQAVSGSQVVVRRGDSLSVLAVRDRADRVGGEVSVRVLLGDSGAGLACETDDAGGFLLEVDPGAAQLVLFSRRGEERTVVETRPASVGKGIWARLGLRCEPDLVVGYLDGKAMVRQAAPLGRARLALWADGGVTAQFDDLRYALGSDALTDPGGPAAVTPR